LLDRLGGLLGDGVAVEVLAEANVDRKRASVGGEHPAGIVVCLAQVTGDRAGLNGCRHDNELEVGAFVALESFDETKREVAHQIALVKFVEQHRTDVDQARVILQPAKQHALGNELYFGVEAGVILKANLIADFTAELGRTFPSNATGERSGGDSARLQHYHFAAATEDVVEDDLRNLCGLAGAGRSGEHKAAVHSERVDDFAVNVPDGEQLVHAGYACSSVEGVWAVKAGGPVFRAWSGGSPCCACSASRGSVPARRSRVRTLPVRQPFSGCW